jgi:hypothetical protein
MHVRKCMGLLLAGLVVFVGSGRARPGEKDDARSVVDQAIKAAGGADNLAKQATTTWTETGKYYGMGDGVPFTGKYAMAGPDRFRMEIENFFTLIYNGEKGWIKAGGDTKEMTPEEHATQKHDHQAGWIAHLVPLKDKAFTLTALGESKVDNNPAVAVKVTRKGYPEVKLYFDKKTHLLVKSTWRTKAPEMQYKEVDAEMYYSNYKEVQGAKVPMKLVMKRDGKVFVEAEVQDMKVVDKLDSSLFDRP